MGVDFTPVVISACRTNEEAVSVMSMHPALGPREIPKASMVDASILAGERHRLRRVRPAWLIAIAIVIIATGGLLTLWPYANHDHIDLLDDPVVSRAADAACTAVSTALSTTQGLSGTERITAGNTAINSLITKMNALGADVLAGDQPSTAWIADWRSLQGARNDIALAISTAPQAQLVVPLTPDGYPITQRMIDSSGPSCAQAVRLAAAP